MQKRRVVGEIPGGLDGQHRRLPAVLGQVLDELGDTLYPAQTHRREIVGDDEEAAQGLVRGFVFGIPSYKVNNVQDR